MLITKEVFNFSDSLFKSLGFNKHSSLSQFDFNLPKLEQVLEDNKDNLFSAKSNLGFCRKLQNLLFKHGLNICYSHKNPWRDNKAFEFVAYYTNYWDNERHIEVTIHMDANDRSFVENFDNIKFELFSTLCHEVIHLLRDKKGMFKNSKHLASSKDLEMSSRMAHDRYYLSDTEEIAAYALQIAMENKYYGESSALSRYYWAFRNQKLTCAKPVLLSLHATIDEYENLPIFCL